MSQNPLLQDLVSAHGLSGLGGGLSVSADPGITSLMDLQSITTINGTLAITGCPDLTSLEGVGQITGLTYLSIAACPSLSQCAVESVCAYLSDPAKLTNLHSNGPGCANRAEVEASCALLSVDDALRIDPDLSIHPNPSSGLVTLKIAGPGNMEFAVFALAGRSVHEGHLTAAPEGIHSIDLSHLPLGCYMLRVQRGQSFSAVRFVRH